MLHCFWKPRELVLLKLALCSLQCHLVMSSDTERSHPKWLFGNQSFPSCMKGGEVPFHNLNHSIPGILLVANAGKDKDKDDVLLFWQEAHCCHMLSMIYLGSHGTQTVDAEPNLTPRHNIYNSFVRLSVWSEDSSKCLYPLSSSLPNWNTEYFPHSQSPKLPLHTPHPPEANSAASFWGQVFAYSRTLSKCGASLPERPPTFQTTNHLCNHCLIFEKGS